MEVDEFFPLVAEQLKDGKLLVAEANLALLEDRLSELHLRASHYGEYSHTKLSFLELIEELQLATRALRRSGEA